MCVAVRMSKRFKVGMVAESCVLVLCATIAFSVITAPNTLPMLAVIKSIMCKANSLLGTLKHVPLVSYHISAQK